MNATQGTLFPITTPKLPFKQWKLREGERLYNYGPQHLSNTELLAHITRDPQVAERLSCFFDTHSEFFMVGGLNVSMRF